MLNTIFSLSSSLLYIDLRVPGSKTSGHPFNLREIFRMPYIISIYTDFPVYIT